MAATEQSTPTLPQTGFIRLAQVLQFIPVKKTRWYDGIKAGEFPAPVKFGRASFYRVEDIRNVIERIGTGA